MSRTEPSAAPDGTITEATRKRVLRIVFFTVFLDLVGFGIVIPLMPLYVESMGGSPQAVGFVLSCFAGSQLIATPVLGRLSDQFGRRRIILVSLAGNAFAMCVFALATSWKMLPLLFVSRMVAGLTAGNLSACQAAIADITDDDADRASAMGTIGAGIGVGLVIGPVLGGVLSKLGGWVPPLGAASMALLDLVLAAMFLPETLRRDANDATDANDASDTADTTRANDTTHPSDARAGDRKSAARSPMLEAFGNPKFVAILAIYFLAFLAMSNLQVAFALLAKARLNLGADAVSYMFGLYGLISVAIQGFAVGKLTRHFGDLGLLAMGATIATIGMALVTISYTTPMLVLSMVVYAIGSGVLLPCASSVASKLAGRGRQGALLGLAQSSGGAARTVGPSWGGFLFSHVGPGAPFAAGAVATGVAVIVALGLRRATKETSPPTPSTTTPSGGAPPKGAAERESGNR